jgi:hypothetical protein
MLATDEERERKAEWKSPGTYHVVVTPDSFQHLPEYSDDSDVKSIRLSPLGYGSLVAPIAKSQGSDPAGDGVYLGNGVHHDVENSNVVILRRFEDATRRTTLQWKDSTSPSPPRAATTSSESSAPMGEGPIDFDPSPSLMQRAAEGGQDCSLLYHFRHHVWRQLAQVDSERRAYTSTRPANSGVEVLEHAARFFPPVCPVAPCCLSLNMLTEINGPPHLSKEDC